MLDRSAPKNRVNVVLYSLMVVWGRISIDGCLGVFRPAWPSSLWRDRRLASRTPADEDDSIGSQRAVVADGIWHSTAAAGVPSASPAPTMSPMTSLVDADRAAQAAMTRMPMCLVRQITPVSLR